MLYEVWKKNIILHGQSTGERIFSELFLEVSQIILTRAAIGKNGLEYWLPFKTSNVESPPLLFLCP
jgi:hypothetical protein